MIDGKKCAMIRQTWYETACAHLSDMARLTFYECCFRYEFTGEIPTTNTCKYQEVLLLFDMVKDTLKNDIEKAERIAERNRQNGQRGGRPKNATEDNEPLETQRNPVGTQKNPAVNLASPLHNTTPHNTTNAASSNSGSGVLDATFFDAQIWPRLNKSGKWNTRHRKCVQAWCDYSERKRAAIAKYVLSDLFVGAENPFFYLEDFEEPHPEYLTGSQCDQIWKAGGAVVRVKDNQGVWQYITREEAISWGIDGYLMRATSDQRRSS